MQILLVDTVKVCGRF